MELAPAWEPNVAVLDSGNYRLVEFGEDPLAVNARAAASSRLWNAGRGGYVGLSETTAIRSIHRDLVMDILEFDGRDEITEPIIEELNVAGLLHLSLARGFTPGSAGLAWGGLSASNPADEIGLVVTGLAISDGQITQVVMVETDADTLVGMSGVAVRNGPFLIDRFSVGSG